MNTCKLVLILSVFLSINSMIFSQNLNLSDRDIYDFVEDLKNNRKVNYDIRYIWSGIITEIKNDDNGFEITVLKGKWIDSDTIVSSRFILKTDKTDMINKIKKTGLYKRIVVILKVISVRDGFIPVCDPVILIEI
ncbi:MAG: hypothetical protein JXB50_10885 [Spirochaetes bacterium]|nr:hypothetical protein [Spirochaetota bacterium]